MSQYYDQFLLKNDNKEEDLKIDALDTGWQETAKVGLRDRWMLPSYDTKMDRGNNAKEI